LRLTALATEAVPASLPGSKDYVVKTWKALTSRLLKKSVSVVI